MEKRYEKYHISNINGESTSFSIASYHNVLVSNLKSTKKKLYSLLEIFSVLIQKEFTKGF